MHLNTNDEENKVDPNPVMCGEVKASVSLHL